MAGRHDQARPRALALEHGVRADRRAVVDELELAGPVEAVFEGLLDLADAVLDSDALV